ncbi:MAG: tRNA lysidine(34) synthetase TilS [Bacteroidales bacterium]|nr:tRNA lysidine(34) synthetase TilS [Bacteroidales bacterium]
MLESLKTFLLQECLLQENQKILLTVSGGIDSMVMLDLFSKLDYSFSIAHCNFKLRGGESDADCDFVKSQENRYQVEVNVKEFDTEVFAQENKISIQMAARQLRYEWFSELKNELGYDLIATAHNLDDKLETFFINLSRGTGIKGLTGIKAKSNDLIRPLLWAGRNDILDYANINDIPWREDSSNSSTKYLRNKLRHDIIPLFKELNPGFLKTMAENMAKLQEAADIYIHEINKKKLSLLEKRGPYYYISADSLCSEDHYRVILYEILQDFGFSTTIVDDIMVSLKNNESGKIFFSPDYRLVKDRDQLIIEEISDSARQRFYIDEGQEEINVPLMLTFESYPVSEFQIIPEATVAQLDYDKLEFPLILRRWEKGDYFRPLGMQGMKKLSDFFINSKLSIPEKEKLWILASGNQIVWIIGHRIDDRYKVTSEAEMVLRINYFE